MNNEKIMNDQKPHQSTINSKTFCNLPIMCPWVSSQPYQSSLFNKNRPIDKQTDATVSDNPWTNNASIKQSDISTMQQSSSQFFFFLRLMQLFPDTHPATLHTVLTLSKNDFFCAVDRLLYVKRHRALYCKKQEWSDVARRRNEDEMTVDESVICSEMDRTLKGWLGRN